MAADKGIDPMKLVIEKKYILEFSEEERANIKKYIDVTKDDYEDAYEDDDTLKFIKDLYRTL